MSTLRTLVLGCGIFMVSFLQVSAQEKLEKVVLKKDFEIQKHTIMERFEPQYMVSAEERAEMKKERIAKAEYTLNVLDTMDISNRKRKLLLRDLKYNPFSDRLNKFIVDIKIEDEDVVIKQEE